MMDFGFQGLRRSYDMMVGRSGKGEMEKGKKEK